MSRTTCPLCGDTADDVSRKSYDLDNRFGSDVDPPEHLLDDDGGFAVKEYEHGRTTSSMGGSGALGPMIKVERRCTVAVKAIVAARDGDLPKPLCPELADHRTKQAEVGSPSAGCGTYPHIGDRQVHIDFENGEVEVEVEDAIEDYVGE